MKSSVPLTEMSMSELLAFTRMTGDLVKAMRACPQPIIVPWRASAPAQVRLSPWQVTSAMRRPLPKLPSCLIVWD
jgi:hypothetical protein